MRGKNTLTAWIMAGIGAVFVLWLARDFAEHE